MSKTGVFSAPRRFDLATTLVVTTAYAAIFALLRALDFAVIAVAIVVAFFTLVALGQAILFGGKHPRWASSLVGSAYFVTALTIYSLSSANASGLHRLPSMIVFIGIHGAFFGYVAGVLVGFVFMVAHGVRIVFTAGKSEPVAREE